MSQEIPLFDIGREWDAFLKDPPTRDSDFSSSGDEVMSQMELDLENITPCPSPCQQSTTSNSSSRFKVTTEAERERILEDADAANTKRNTKGAVKIFKNLFAALVPNMELLMSLVGSFATCVLVFIFPPLAEICVLSREPGALTTAVKVKDGIIFTFGVLAFLTGTYSSIKDIVEAF